MSRKVSSTCCKAKQIPRIFQRRNQTVRAVRGVVKNVRCSPDIFGVDCGITDIQASPSANIILEANVRESDEHYNEVERRKNGDNVGNVNIDNNYSTKILHSSVTIDDVNTIDLKIDEESLLEKSASRVETVEDIEKWLKTRAESVSGIDLDAIKSVVEAEEEADDRHVGVGVDSYLADDLQHAFLDKDPDGLSIDIDLSDKKLSLDYDPLLRELRSEKLLEACEKSDDFILPEFRLDHLDPLALSPRDMMVAGEILPSASHRPSTSLEDAKIAEGNGVAMENDDTGDSEMEELTDKPIQVDYSLAEELENIGKAAAEENRSNGRYLPSENFPTAVGRVLGVTSDGEIKPEGRSELKTKSEPKAVQKRRRIRPKPDVNEITFLGEPCHIDGEDSVMAVVAISTDKISNMTQIVINTGMDEQIYQGKTSELIEATGNFPKIAKIDMDATTFPARDRPHERMVSKALEELGITDESLEPSLVNENGRVWLCPREDCNREFCKLHALKAHLLAHFGVRPFKCDYEGCTWAFHSEFKLKRHKETHLKRKNFVCEVPGCNRRFTTVYNLWSHEKLHTRPNRIICQVPDCHEKFQTKRALGLHMKNHDQSHAPYLCNHDGCGKRYYTSNALTSHQRCHNYKEIDVKCSWPGCGKIFDKPCRLKAHVRSHTGSKPYTCTYQDCQWAFSSSSKLKRHQKKHTNERKFLCNVETCGKAFMRSEHLKEHLLTHAGGGYFQCYMCDAHFSAKSSLYVHIKKHQVKDAVEAITEGIPNVSKRIQESRETPKNLFVAGNKSQGIGEFRGDCIVENGSMGICRINEANVPRRIVKKEPKNLSYSCAMDECGHSYKTLSSLANHMIEIHGKSILEDNESPIGISPLTTEASDLDYILYATPSSNSNGTCRAMMLESCDAVIMSESAKNVACLPEPEPPPSSTFVEAEPRLSASSFRTIGDKRIFPRQPRVRKTCQGSARTGLTCEDVWKLKSRSDAPESTNVGATDVVLGTADLNEGLLLTEELPSMYYQDDIVGTECQILLLDNGNTENPIDLRGLV